MICDLHGRPTLRRGFAQLQLRVSSAHVYARGITVPCGIGSIVQLARHAATCFCGESPRVRGGANAGAEVHGRVLRQCGSVEMMNELAKLKKKFSE